MNDPQPGAAKKTREGGGRNGSPLRDKAVRTSRMLVKAAQEEFLERGYGQATMSNIAKRAELSKGTMYLYFNTKLVLFEAVLGVMAADLVSSLEGQRASGETVKAFLQRTLMPALRDLSRTGRDRLILLVWGESTHFPELARIYWREVYEPMLACIRGLADAAFKEGELASNKLSRYPYLLLGGNWPCLFNNVAMNPSQRMDMADAFDANLDLLFMLPANKKVTASMRS